MTGQILQYLGAFFLGFAAFVSIFFAWRFVKKIRTLLKEAEIIKNTIVQHQNILTQLKQLVNATSAATRQDMERTKKELFELLHMRQPAPLEVVKENENEH